jgi:cytidylate kinase
VKGWGRFKFSKEKKVLTNNAAKASAELTLENFRQCASIVSADLTVRKALLEYQKNFCVSPPAGARGAVLDGRDIGTGLIHLFF